MDVFDRAVIFAVKAHEGQRRKRGGAYIIHPLETAAIASTLTDDSEVLAAAVLHDTVEDAGVTPATLIQEFGERVARLILSETEDKRADLPPSSTWRIRKEESIAILNASTDVNVKIIWLADKLSNMRAFYRDYIKTGDDLWQRFHQNDPKEQHWYYRTVADAVSELSDFPAWKEYDALIDKVFEQQL